VLESLGGVRLIGQHKIG